mgnify:FL=1
MIINIGVVQFPGSNTERETSLAIKRVKMNPVEILWNSNIDLIKECHGYVITGGFSYEDRSRAGVIASLETIIDILKNESKKGKPIFGICNGAQILVESGLVPGALDNQTSVALADNKRIKSGEIVGTGYYNAWANLKLSVHQNSTAFTRHFSENEMINIPFAHAEGRFIIPNDLLDEMKTNNQTVFRYCDNNGKVSSEFPTNPNGSDYNLAAISNTNGNVLAMMPHPERTEYGDKLFSSMKEFIEHSMPLKKEILSYKPEHKKIVNYEKNENSNIWIVDLIITDNEAISVQNALQKKGLDVKVGKQIHWEINCPEDSENVLKQIETSGELFNSNKEFLSELPKDQDTHSVLVRQKDDMHCQKKFNSLKQRFKIKNLLELKRGVVWNITIKNANFNPIFNNILNTNILHNPLSHECFRIS